ncbi:MAG: hypothetical protein J3Q66DRAFT_341127 [Benniella sp.]|nr:MAG: hypothetical protein J3Q66DRAFT_341127 [Benniella sp.]
MDSTIAPPASLGLVSGTAFSSVSPEALARILDELDMSSLEQEHSRLKHAIKQLEQSNKEIAEFMELEQQEFKEKQQHNDTCSSNGYEPDPEFVIAIEENKVVIAKYEKTCAELMKAIERKGGSRTCGPSRPTEQQEPVESNRTTEEGETTQDDGIYL